MVSLREQFEALRALSSDAPAVDKRSRGFEFEKFLERMLDSEHLEPSIRLRPTGEEIDGSFTLDQRVYLLEAKWHEKPLPASTIYMFKGKVDGKLFGTIGIFISMSGYSEDAIDALIAGKDLNVVLMDANDIEAAIDKGFAHVLRVKLRAAAEVGAVFFPITNTLATISDANVTVDSAAPTDVVEFAKLNNQIIILCESHSDIRILNRLGQRILEHKSLSANLRFVAAQGKHGIPRVMNAIYPLLPNATPLIVVVDSDGQVEETDRAIREEVTIPFTLVIIDPEIEAWVKPSASNPRQVLKQLSHAANQSLDMYIDKEIENVNLEEMCKKAPSFQLFYDSIVKAVTR